MCSNITPLIGELLKEQKCLEFFKFLLNLLFHTLNLKLEELRVNKVVV